MQNENDPNDDAVTHFGFTTVREAEKASRVHGVFTSVSSKYDIMNDVMSMGIHRIWKDALMDWLNPQPRQRLLDVAGGTGDVAFRFLKLAGDEARATVCDMTESMLIAGQQRDEAAKFEGQLEWIVGDAMALPFDDASFDRYTISFGIRNVTSIQKAMDEAYRVLDYGGRMMILEFNQMPNEMLQKLYDAYSFTFIPRMGEVIAKDRESYQYLVESIRKMPSQDTMVSMLETSGFQRVSYRNFSGGIATIHSAWKL